MAEPTVSIELLRRLLEYYQGNITLIAGLIGVNRRTLQDRIRSLENRHLLWPREHYRALPAPTGSSPLVGGEAQDSVVRGSPDHAPPSHPAETLAPKITRHEVLTTADAALIVPDMPSAVLGASVADLPRPTVLRITPKNQAKLEAGCRILGLAFGVHQDPNLLLNQILDEVTDGWVGKKARTVKRTKGR